MLLAFPHALRQTIKRLVILVSIIMANSAVWGQSKQSDELFAQGVDLYNAGNYTDAIPLFEQVMALDEMDLPQTSERQGYGCNWLSSCYYKLGNIDKAREIDPINFNFAPVDRRLTVESDKYSDLANEAFDAGDIKSALIYAKKCMDIEELALGVNSLYYVGSQLKIGNFYINIEDAVSALKFYENGLNILENMNVDFGFYKFCLLRGKILSLLATNDVDAARSAIVELSSVANYEKRENNDGYPEALVEMLYSRAELQSMNYEAASQHAVTAFSSYLNLFTADNEEIFTSMIDCINELFMMNKPEIAASLLKQALNLMTDDRDHRGILLSYLGQATGDVKAYEESLEYLISERYINEYLMAKSLLAGLYARDGRYPEAIALCNQICDYYDGIGSNQGEYKGTLMRLGDIYRETGDNHKAYDYYMRLIKLLQDDKQNPDYLLTVMKWVPIWLNTDTSSNLGGNGHSDLNGTDIFRDFVSLTKNINIGGLLHHGVGLPVFADAFLTMMQAFLQKAIIVPGFMVAQGVSWSNIEMFLSEFHDYLRSSLCTEDDPLLLWGKSLLAHSKYVNGKYDEAIDLMKQIVNTCKVYDIPKDTYLHDLAYYQYESGDTRGAYENFRIGYESNKDHLLRNYRWMTVDERSTMTRSFRGNLDNIPHYAALTPDDSRYAELGYDAMLFTKGLQLNPTLELSRLMQESGDGESMAILEEWRTVNRRQQLLGERGDYEQAKQMKHQADSIERLMLERSKEYGDFTEGLSVSFQEVQAALQDNDVAIEFFSFQKDAKRRTYGALVLTKTRPPVYVPVGDDADWWVDDSERYASETLFNALFADLKSFLPKRGEGDVYFAPNGLLHVVAIENLPGAEPYSLKRLSSTRELALAEHSPEASGGMTVMGGVKYGLGELEELYDDGGSGLRESVEFLHALPGTLTEAEKIHSLMAARIPVSKLVEQDATETSVKALSGKGTSILHIATHGFINHPTDAQDAPTFEQMVMKSSGLYLAGAQNTIYGEPIPSMKDDGILTAEEISMLDLRGLKLAVLSACETGQGHLTSDGVFGLQRGFKQAGARGLMMSLWKVDDDATQMLMEAFYTSLLSGHDQYDALREAQAQVRKSYPDPKYWAAFILIDAIGSLTF